MIGTTVDKYEVLRKVGEGGMSTVYLGRHRSLDRDVAIKVLHPHLSASTRNRRRFAREARAIEQLRHPNIVEIFDYSGEGDESWIVTEYVPGETLGAALERVGAVPSEVAATLGIALAEALAYAHTQGILHRDLKPDNVMIRKDGVVKLMDFGIARFLDESQVTLTGALVGSPAFMSPEQARDGELGPASDLFSLGTLLFLCVSGRLPFGGGNPSVVLRQILENERPLLDEVAPDADPAFCELVERLLAHIPGERPKGALEVARALRACLAETGFDPSDEAWSLTSFFRDPDGYREALRTWLVPRLLQAARARLAQGDALAGLRLVNRVLSLHDGHPEALELLEAVHGARDRDPRRRVRLAAGAGALLLVSLGALALGGWWGATPRAEAPAPPETAAAARIASPSAPEAPAPDAAPPGASAPDAPGLPPVPAGADEVAAPTPPPTAVAALRLPDTPQRTPKGSPATDAGADADAPMATIPDTTPACIGFRTPAAPAEVFLDGVRVRSTREPGCAVVKPGRHVFVLRGPMVQEKAIPVTLGPGEVRDPVIVELERLPVRVRFDDDLDDTCVALVDGVPRGTLAALGRSLELARPEQAHEIRVACGGASWVQRFPRIDYPEVLFAGRAEP